MRDQTLDEPAALIYCPCRALLYLPGWADRRRTFPATSWRPAVRPAPTAADTEDSLAQAGRSPFSPRIRAPAMTLPLSGGLTGDAVASKGPGAVARVFEP